MSKKEKKKGSWLLKIVAVFAACIIIGVLFGKTEESPGPQEPVKQAEAKEEPTKAPEPTAKPESNTSAMVDSIISKARDDAASLTEEKAKEAFTAIYDSYPDFFTDNETMEKLMYYGALLEYGYEGKNDAFYNLGMDTVQAIKYVYRGVEKIEDEATQENLNQIHDTLESALGATK